ncbi:hypothetical protein GCM10023317_40410 [Actinopolymorpha pittospori]
MRRISGGNAKNGVNCSHADRHSLLSQAGHPMFGALTAGADPHPEHVPLAGEVHPDRDLDGPVGDLPVPDLDVDSVDQHHRIEPVQRP